MALPQLLQWVSGKLVGLNPVQSSAGASSAGSVVALNSSGQVDATMLPPTNTVLAAGAATLAASVIVGTATLTSAASAAVNFAGSTGSCGTAATAAATFNVYHVPAGTSTQTLIGTVSFAAGAYAPTFATESGANLSFAVGDTLLVLAPSTVDSTLATVSISLLLTPDVSVMSVSGGASTLPASSIVMGYCATVAGSIPAQFAGSTGSCGTAATAAATFNVYHVPAGQVTQTLIGTVSFAAGAYAPTFATESGVSRSFGVGDTLLVLAPSTADSTLANVSLSIVGVN
ncbi:hypothetical protein [Acidithiobacillus albertensis]|uniref:hypothetical protein n=1 Tax=Acidithiobacillus albertensis TaxID=119978 RepID=UPI00094AF3CD|nr:hypothetical protein [Acidithiobacillus albertensis]